MGKFKRLVIGLIMILIGSTSVLAGCDPYRKLEVSFDRNEVVFYLSDNPEENIFSLSATVSGNKKDTSTDVTFDIHTTQGVIEQYGDVSKDDETSTIQYRALSKGTVDVYVTTKEGNKTDKCTVDIRIPIKGIGFNQDSLIINRGTKKDFSSFVSYNPTNTSQTDVEFSILSADVAEEVNQIHVDGTSVLVEGTSTLTSFTMKVACKENTEITNEITVYVIDTVDNITIEGFDGTDPDNPYIELEKVNGEYELNLAQNVDDSSLYEKLIKIKGFVGTGDTAVDKGYMGTGSDYDIRILKYNASTDSYSQISLPYTGDHVQISKQLSNSAYKISQLSKGTEKFKIVVDFAGHEGEFTSEAILNVNVKGLPTDINILSSNKEVDTLTLFMPIEGSSVQGISVDVQVVGVGGELLTSEPVLISFVSESGAEAKVTVKNKYGDVLSDLTKPMTVANDSPLLLSHYYEGTETIPTDVYMVFTSQNYTKVFTKVLLVFNTSDIASIEVPSEFRISSSETGKEMALRYLDANAMSTSFDNKLLTVTIGNTSIVELDKTSFEAEGKIILKPKKVGRTTFSVTAPNGVKSLTSNIVVFEELTDDTTIKVFDTTLQPISIDSEIKDIVVKTHGTYPIKYNINNKYSTLLTDMTSKISTTSSVFNIIDGAIVTSKSVGTGSVTVTIKGYNADGELSKTLEFTFNVIVKAPLISATPNIYIETIYDRNDVLNYEDTLAKRNIRFSVNPTNASYTAEDMSWIIKIGSTIIEATSKSTQVVGSSTIETYVFNYNGNRIYIETNPQDLKAATVYATLSSSNNSLVFNAICQIRQTFKNENGIETTSVNEDVNVTFTVLNPTKVSTIVLNNVKQTSVELYDGTTSIKNSYTFDTRDMTVDNKGTFTSGNEYVVNFTLLPSNATIQELSVTHSQSVSDLEVTVDNANKQIKIKVNRQLSGETIIYIRSNDSTSTNVVEQQLYLKVANGSFENPFEIANASDFERISHSLTSHYVLVSDVNLQSISDYSPIGTASNPFLGTLNGKNKIVLGDSTVYVQHTIYNLTIRRTQGQESENKNYFGMFGYIGETGAVANIKLSGVSIDIADSFSNEDAYVGAIAGFSKGLIYNCTVTDSSSIDKATVQQIFEDSNRTPGIKYRSMGASKYAYVGGIVGMLIGMTDITETFSDKMSIIDGVTTSFQDNIAYMSIMATTTIPSGAVVAGGLVGYNLGAHMYSNNSSEYDSIVAINTNPNTSFRNDYSIFGGIVGTNFGTIENYTSKSYINGGNYVGGLAGVNFGKVLNNTILPVIRGEENVGGLIGFNLHSERINLNPNSSATNYQKAITKAMFPAVYTDGMENSIFALEDDTFYTNIFTLTGDVDEYVIYPIANTLIKGNKVQFVDNANIHFAENKKANAIYNTAIIGGKNVGGLIGASYDDNTETTDELTKITYSIEETIVDNSVYSYFVVQDGGRVISNYAVGTTEGNNAYYGDIISTYTGEFGNIGGLIGVANHLNIIKAFVHVNIAFASNTYTQYIGGIVGNVTGSTGSDAIFRVVDSHTSGVINNPNNPNVKIGAFIGNGDNIDNKGYSLLLLTYYQSIASKFYNIESSYSTLEVRINTSTTFVSGFSGTDTMKAIPEGVIGTAGQYLPNENSTGDHYYYDNLTAINSFYIGFKINYLDKYEEDDQSGIDVSSSLAGSDTNYDKVKQLEFTYEEAIIGYHEFTNGDKFYYYNLENSSGNTIQYANFNLRAGQYARLYGDVYNEELNETESVVIDIKWVNVELASVTNKYTFNTYYIEEENVNEDGFGINPIKQDFGNGEENAIDTMYNWYHNVYEYENPVNTAEKYKAYNGLPIPMSLQENLLIGGSPSKTYDNALRFVVDLPPMGIGVEFKEDRSKTFIHDYNGGKEILLTITELDSKYYNTDGTLTAFNNYVGVDKINLSNEVKSNIDKENTYLLSDVIDITALPRFVGSSKLQYRSVYGLVEFGYDTTGNSTLKVLGAGRDQIEITSLYNTEVTYIVNVNIISKLSNIKILQNKRATAEMSTIEVVKNVETSFFADINSVYNRTINSRQYEFDLVQRQNVGTRYYFTYNIGDRLSVLYDTPMAGSVEMLYKLNGQNVIEEAVEVGGTTKYIRYVDITSNEVSILGAEDFSEYSAILAVPYMVLDGENFFKVTIEEVENIASSYTKGSEGMPGTFANTHDLIKPLQIKIYNKTFGMQVDKTSVEFSAYIEPVIKVTLTTDNFDENLYYVVSNGITDSGEANVDDPSMSRVTTLGNLQVTAYDPDMSAEAIANRAKAYEFKFSVVKTNGYYNTINDNENFTITFYTKDDEGNVEYVRTINISLLPQPVTNTSVLHYPSSEYEEVVVDGVVTFVPKANEVAYDNIIPGYMGLLKINLSPYYANIYNVVIESSVVDGKKITFEQLVYEENEATGEFRYITAYPQAQTTTNGIIALKRSNNGINGYEYDGNIYARTILPSNVATGTMFTISVIAYGYANGELVAYKTETLELEAICPPGLHVTYKGSNFGVVARGTNNTISVTGDGLEDAYIDFDKYTTLSIYGGATEYGVAGKIKISQVSATEYSLSVASDIPQGSTIVLVGYTERYINDKLYTSRSELRLKVADFVVESITVENVYGGQYQSILNQTQLLRVLLDEVSYNASIPGMAKKLKEFTESISTKLNSRNENATWYQRIFNLDGSYNDISLTDGDYGTFVIDLKDDGNMYIRNTVKNSTDVLVAKAIINYSFGTSPNIQLGDPNEYTTANPTMDESFIIELECQFSFNVSRNTDDETPEPISTAEQFIGMEAGINYILTNDIVLTNYKPISTEITSLDGNGYVITIKDFDTAQDSENASTSINLGLFETVSDATILKNIVVEIVPLGAPYIVEETSNNSTQDLLVDVSSYNSVNFGFIAATNNGIITNAQVVNDKLANEIRREREAMLDQYYDDSEYTAKTYTDVPNRSISVVKVLGNASMTTANVGGLVAINNGYITNSRVENITINGVGYVAGIAVRNSGTISSTYYKGANLLNQSSEYIDTAGTAGLVVFNTTNGTIQYCYTMSREGWSYSYDPDEEENLSNGKITYYGIDMNLGDISGYSFNIGATSGQDYLNHRDITGISATEKNLFTGVYNASTLVVNDGTANVDIKENTELYRLALITLLNDSDMFTLRAVNSGINVDTDASGFVFENEGTISNSYSNLLVNAAHSAGFVFTSGETGIIEDCYSLSSVRVGSDAHSPFTGKTLENTEATYNATTANISYSHYLRIDQSIKFTTEGDNIPYTIVMLDKFYDTGEPATNLEANEIFSYNSFQGYAFNSDFELNVDILRSVWFIPSRINASSYNTYEVIKNNFKHSYYAPNRPELISANLRTMSVRVLLNDYETSTTLQYDYLPSLIVGDSIRNPYLVYNAKTFNDYGTMSIKTNSGEVNKSYIRFISDITFDGSSINSIKAETYNTAFAGDIDGNGMIINDLKLIAESNLEASEEINHLGLFGKLYSFSTRGTGAQLTETYTAIVRNLNIEVTSIDGTGVTYVGALAGEMIDAFAFNIRVTADAGVYVNGSNAVGGVVGKISGNSELVNVATNISVSATNKTTLTNELFAAYDGTEETLKNISYAGGVVGVVDVNGRNNDVKTAQKYARIRKIDVYGSTTISGDISGGIFGYVGNNSVISDVHFTITNDGKSNPRIVSKYSAGGIVGELRGKIERSYITHSNQSELNDEIVANMNTATHTTTLNSAYTTLFNGSSMATNYYMGGIAGMNLGGTISDSYTNVDVINGVSMYAGGVIGLNIGGTIKSVYTTGSVRASYVGGFIGLAVNGGLLEVRLATTSSYVSTLHGEGLKISNILDLVTTKLELSSAIVNSIVSANIWRQEDLDKVFYNNIGSFIGKVIDETNYNTDGSSPAIISTSSDSSRQIGEVNVFANATKLLNGTYQEIQEIGAANSDCSYSTAEDDYTTGHYGVVFKEESGYCYYSRMKNYGSLRTIEEIVSRTTSGMISKSYEKTNVNVGTSSGEFVKYNVNLNHKLPNIYKGWSAIYWEGTAVNNLGEADSDHVLPSLIARPNVSIVRVYDKNDLEMMSTLLSSEFVLMNDIDLEGSVWNPVGTDSDPFTGSLHSDYDSSNNYNSWTIKNVTIAGSDGNSVGFFGTISGATLNDFNLHITEIAIEQDQYELHVGGLVGLVKEDNESNISNVVVFGGEMTDETGYNDYVADGNDDAIENIGTSELYYIGSSNITASNVLTMGGAIGTSYNSIFTDLHTRNLHLEAKAFVDEGTTLVYAGAPGTDLYVNAYGGVVGYFHNDKTFTTDNLTSKNIYVGNPDTTVYQQNVYIGGIAGFGNSAYMRNIMATNFVVDEDISILRTGSDEKNKNIYVGGLVGDFTGIVFDGVVYNDPTQEILNFTLGKSATSSTPISNKLKLKITGSYNKTSLHIGGAFGSLSGLGVAYEDTPLYYGSTAVRPDRNPFGVDPGATGIYQVPSITNALVVENVIDINSESSASPNSYIGGVVGIVDATLYNVVSYGDMTLAMANTAYVGALAGQARNNYIQNVYVDRDITFTDKETSRHNNSLHIGGAIGYAENIGDLASSTMNKESNNIVSNGSIDVVTNRYATTYAGGLIAKSKNITLNSSISNTNITLGSTFMLDRDDGGTNVTNISYVGGFVGYFEQANASGARPTIIHNSYCTGSIAIATDSYQNGGAGGFVGYVTAETDNKDIYDGGGAIAENSANIKNCYSISRIIPYDSDTCQVTNEVKNNIINDDATLGGFVGTMAKNVDILTNCYFNKEIFTATENSNNELVVKRHIGSNTVYRNFGIGLTLEDMLYNPSSALITAFSGEGVRRVKPLGNGGDIYVKDPADVNGLTNLSMWNFEANTYPTLQFYHETDITEVPTIKSPDVKVPMILEYLYTNQFFGYKEYYQDSSDILPVAYGNLSKYNIAYLLDGHSVESTYTITYYIQDEKTIYSTTQHVYYSCTSVKNSSNPYGIQAVGTEQNPMVVNTATVALNSTETNTVDGVPVTSYTYDATDKSMIIMNATALTNSYMGNTSAMVNGTILFKNSVLTNISTLKFNNIDVHSFIYGLTTNCNTHSLFGTVYGEVKNLSIVQLQNVTFISTNYGYIDVADISSTSMTAKFVGNNYGTIDTVKYTIGSAVSGDFDLTTTNYGYIDAVQVELKSSKTSFVEDNFEISNDNTNGIITNYMIRVDYSSSNVAYKYSGTNNSSYLSFNTMEDTSTTTSMIVLEDTNRTYITSVNNTRAHAIDVFGYFGTYLSEDAVWAGQARNNTPYYDFVNDWVIITGLNNNMPMLRSVLRDNHYDKDIGDAYYFDTTEVAISSGVYNVDTDEKLAYVGNLISEATTGTFTINLIADIDLSARLWKPIDVANEVVVKLQGNGYTISNISVMTTNEDAGLFGTSIGTVRVCDLLMRDGYVVDLAAYTISNTDNDIGKIGYDIYNTYGSNNIRKFGVGAIIGRAYNTNGDTTSITLNRIGNQYVYVAGFADASTDTYDRNVGGLIGIVAGGKAGILDCYVNSPFMHNGPYGSGMANGASNIRFKNTYVVNYDVDTYSTTDDTKYVTNYILNSGAYNATAFIDDSISYATTVNNYYLSLSNTIENTAKNMGATLDKLRTHTLPVFDWSNDWVRVQEDNDALPYNMFEAEYWIQDGASATSTDISVSGNTYTIKTARGLANVAYLSKNGNTFSGKTLKLNADLDMSGKIWSPIGYITNNEFKGTFDGNGKKISNLSITQFFNYDGTTVTPSSDNNYIGFIAKSNDATIKNLTISNARISGNNYVAGIVAYATDTVVESSMVDDKTTITGLNYVGGIVGYHTWDTSNTTRFTAVISQTDNYARVSGYNRVGGIVGKSSGTIIQMCTNNGEICNSGNSDVTTAGTSEAFGGIVGETNAYVYEVINNGAVHAYDAVFAASNVKNVGGIAGYVSNGKIYNALNNGEVDGTETGNIGLIIGIVAGNYANATYMTYSDATKKVQGSVNTSTPYVGAQNVSGEYVGATSVLADTSVLLKDNSVWSRSGGSLVLNNKIPSDYSGVYVLSNAFTINSDTGYNYLNYLIHRRANYGYENGKDYFDITVNTGTTYSVTNKYTDSSGAYIFQGTMDSSSSGTRAVFNIGNHTTISHNHGGLLGVIKNATIKDIQINTSATTYGYTSYNYQGMLAGVSQGGTALTNIYINSSATLSGASYIGGIIGELSSGDTMTNCIVGALNINASSADAGGFVGYSLGTITSSNASTYKSSAKVSGTTHVGGVVGYVGSPGKIEKTNFDGTVSSSTAGEINVGGIAGWSTGANISSCTVSGSFSAGTNTVGGIVGYVTGATITGCTISSAITADDYVGGVAGKASNTSITNNTISGNLSDGNYIGGAVGYATGSTITGNTYSATISGWTYLGGIAGYVSSCTVSGNTMNGNIYVYRTDDDDGKRNQGIDDFEFGYSVSHAGSGSVTVNNGNSVDCGVLDYSKYRTDNNINFVVGNNSSNDGNSVNTESKITFQDNYVRYSLSISTSHNDNGTVHLVWYEYHVVGTFTVSAQRFEEYYIKSNTAAGEKIDGEEKASNSGSQSVDGSDGGVWSIGASWSDAYNDFAGKISGCSYNFTGSW